MSISTKEQKKTSALAGDEMRSVVFNLPNQLTWMRLVLAVVMFGLISAELYLPAMWLFITAAATDWLDGYFARKYNLITTLGRILDPFADKFIVCGTFIYLAAMPGFQEYLAPWMAVVVVGRELLVTALRSFLEDQGSDFSAKMAGKLKMVFQCAAAIGSLYVLHLMSQELTPAAWLHWSLLATIWIAVLMTIYSGIGYILMAVRLLKH